MSEKREDVREGGSIFNQESGDQVKSPEKLNEYIRVASPWTWLLAVALVLVMAALLVWGSVGRIPVYLQTKGVGTQMNASLEEMDSSNPEEFFVNMLVCMVDAEENMARDFEGKETYVVFRDGTRLGGNVYAFQNAPLNGEELAALLDYYGMDTNWIFSKLSSEGYSYALYVVLDETLDYNYWGEVADVSIVMNEVRPIRFLIG